MSVRQSCERVLRLRRRRRLGARLPCAPMLSSRTARGLAALALTFAATTATAESPKPDFRLDGSVVHDGVTYPTRADWYRSDAFQDHGKCGSIAPPPVSLAAPDDCSMVGTTINPEYDDGRVLVVQVVFHLI